MKIFLSITLLVLIIQIIFVLAGILDDFLSNRKGDKRHIKTKRQVWRMFIPYCWVLSGVRITILWWKSLK